LRLLSSSIADCMAGGHWIGGMSQLITSWVRGDNGLIGLAVPGRPIRSLVAETGAPMTSATGRDQSPDAHGIAHETRRATRDGWVQDETTR
jgi:hypothetical protein